MLRCIALAAAGGLAFSSAAHAVNTPFYDVPYLGLSASGLNPDSNRRVSVAGGGYQWILAYPLASGNQALELRLSDYEMRRDIDGEPNYQTNLTLDFVYDFGAGESDGGFLSGSKPFVFVGGGLYQEDSFGKSGNYFGIEAGGGLLLPLGFKGWAIRLDARVQAQANSDYCNEDGVSIGQCQSTASQLVDYALGAGLQIPLSIFFKPPVAFRPAADCQLAVVDPATGRKSCQLDADRDGVADDADQCPGTESGREVDESGCALRQARSDRDGDGVPDAADACDTPVPGIKVDARGCAVAQTLEFPGSAFDGSSTRLTAEGRRRLAQLAAMMTAQPDVRASISSTPDGELAESLALVQAARRAKVIVEQLARAGIAAVRIGISPTEVVSGLRQPQRITLQLSKGR